MDSRTKSAAFENVALPLLLVFSLALAGCVTTGTPARLAALSESIAASPAGQSLDRAALLKAASAEASALERTPTGGTSDWKTGKRASGTVSPGTPYEVSGRFCRRLTHRITATGNQLTRIVTACREEDGVWKPVNS